MCSTELLCEIKLKYGYFYSLLLLFKNNILIIGAQHFMGKMLRQHI
jgi:hypothetical protein